MPRGRNCPPLYPRLRRCGTIGVSSQLGDLPGPSKPRRTIQSACDALTFEKARSFLCCYTAPLTPEGGPDRPQAPPFTAPRGLALHGSPANLSKPVPLWLVRISFLKTPYVVPAQGCQPRFDRQGSDQDLAASRGAPAMPLHRPGPCSRAWLARRRVVHSSCG
jgi:hypothetical protein